MIFCQTFIWNINKNTNWYAIFDKGFSRWEVKGLETSTGILAVIEMVSKFSFNSFGSQLLKFIKKTSLLLTRLRIHRVYLLLKCKTPEKCVLSTTLNIFRCWGSCCGDLENVEYHVNIIACKLFVLYWNTWYVITVNSKKRKKKKKKKRQNSSETTSQKYKYKRPIYEIPKLLDLEYPKMFWQAVKNR